MTHQVRISEVVVMLTHQPMTPKEERGERKKAGSARAKKGEAVNTKRRRTEGSSGYLEVRETSEAESKDDSNVRNSVT